MKKKIRINCVDVPNGFDNYIFQLFSKYYEVEISENPDILIYSCFGQEFKKYSCLRIFYTGENVRPNFDECDFAFSFDYSDNPKNYRFPDYAAYSDPRLLTRYKNIDRIVEEKTKFCNFFYSDPRPKERIKFFKMLSKYKRVDSFGRVLNNMPSERRSGRGHLADSNWQQAKLDIIRPYKFTIAFENSMYPGHTTEKILHAMLANSIPIYWGNTLIHKDFNPKSFINCHEYSSFKEVVRRVIEIDNNDVLYREMLVEAYYLNNQIPENIREENILERLDFIINSRDKLLPIAQQSSNYKRYGENVI